MTNRFEAELDQVCVCVQGWRVHLHVLINIPKSQNVHLFSRKKTPHVICLNQ